MPKRRLQCGSCSTVIKISTRVSRPVCPRCQTAHTFIKCGRAECGTLMCLPENVNQFSCPRCNVQLARPGHASLESNPMAVRCGNMACDFLMTIPGNVGRFRCPRCQIEQVLPGTEEALKCKARHEEDMRQKALDLRHKEEVRGLCEVFYTMDPSIVEAVYESADKQRCTALQQLMDMAGDTAELTKSLQNEALRLHKVILAKKRIVENCMRCPISEARMADPVMASDGNTYDRASITKWMASKSTSPATGEEMDKRTLVANHQLKSEIESWAEYNAGGAPSVADSDLSCDDLYHHVIPAVSSRPASAAIGGKVLEARNANTQSVTWIDSGRPEDLSAGAEDMEAGATDSGVPHAQRADGESGAGPHPPRAAPGLVASLAKAFSGLSEY